MCSDAAILGALSYAVPLVAMAALLVASAALVLLDTSGQSHFARRARARALR